MIPFLTFGFRFLLSAFCFLLSAFYHHHHQRYLQFFLREVVGFQAPTTAGSNLAPEDIGSVAPAMVALTSPSLHLPVRLPAFPKLGPTETDSAQKKKGVGVLSASVKRAFPIFQQGGVIMDVVNAEQARIAEAAGAVSVMALERIPADIKKDGGLARMSDPALIQVGQPAKQSVKSVQFVAVVQSFVSFRLFRSIDRCLGGVCFFWRDSHFAVSIWAVEQLSSCAVVHLSICAFVHLCI